jgi:hypothetical protein
MKLSRSEQYYRRQLNVPDDVWLRAKILQGYVDDESPDLRKRVIGLKRLQKLVQALDAIDPRWEYRRDKFRLIDAQIWQMYPEAFKKRASRRKNTPHEPTRLPTVSVSGDFAPQDNERDIIRKLEQRVMRKLNFAGASKLNVRVVKDGSGGFEIVVTVPYALVVRNGGLS